MNVSVRPEGRERFGTKVEVKNMNSFSAMQKAIDFEIERQVSWSLALSYPALPHPALMLLVLLDV